MEYSLNDRINFGKYKGLLLRDLMLSGDRADYVRWAVKNIDWFSLDEEAKAVLSDAPSARSDHLWSWLGTEDEPNLTYGDTCEGGWIF